MKRVIPRKFTRFTGETKMTKTNEEALKLIRTLKVGGFPCSGERLKERIRYQKPR